VQAQQQNKSKAIVVVLAEALEDILDPDSNSRPTKVAQDQGLGVIVL
jgi:hypothetical protein